ncbi:hypothetical protein EUX98_g5552 [Antrodiella citrinella]|uniref:Uncharacterized protein n=1 Tax=Antrodiella citrinella TaxID=2447956 RepID=A0A4S4MRA5_9APHY|nr:hypothetical protein EUX98_g5552 [Antrodiella citrinella]
MNTPKDKLDALFPAPAPAPRASALTPVRLAGPSPKSATELIELMQDNHKRLHIFFNDKQFHNHVTHHLLAIHSMGADPVLLKAAYATHIAYQRPAIPSPNAIDTNNYKEFLGDERYYQAYLQFFSDLLLVKGPASVFEEYFMSKDANLVPAKGNGNEGPQLLGRFLGGFLHPLIHSGYGAEFGQLGMWAEGFAEACVQGPLPPGIIPDSLFEGTVPSILSRVTSLTLSNRPETEVKSIHALAILGRVAKDPAFDPSLIGLPPTDGNSIDRVVEACKDNIAKLLDEWTVGATREELDKKIEEVIWMNAVIYGVGGWGGRAHSDDPNKEFNGDFFTMHLVTSSLFISSLTTYLPPATAASFLRTYFITSIVLYVARGRPALPISDFFASVSDAPTPPGSQPTPTQEVFTPEVGHPNPPEAKKNWLTAGGDKVVIPNPWLTITQSTMVHPDEHLCKAQRSLLQFASMFGATAPGYFSSLKGDLEGVDVLDGTLFVRTAGLTANRLGWVREGQAQKSWDHDGFFKN